MQFSIVTLLAIAGAAVAAPSASVYAGTTKKNMIMMVSDGFGPASETLARAWVQQHDQYPPNYMSIIDKIMVGSSRTRSADSFVTDSAPGAVCFASGIKTYNNALGITTNYVPVGTNMEAAHRAGYKTGLVAKSYIADATPAAFASHAANRAMFDLISEQMAGLVPEIGQNVDLMFGGGRCTFIGNATKGSCRTDNKDLYPLMAKNGWTNIVNRTEFNALSATSKLPISGLFSIGNMPYSIDYPYNDVPSLQEMTKKALDILTEATKNSTQGFYIMIEGSRIDHAGHANDAGTHIREILEYWETVKIVSDYIDAHPETAMVSTSDHECGGLTLGRDNNYWLYPLVYTNQTKSQELACNELLAANITARGDLVTNVIVPKYLGKKNASPKVNAAILAANSTSECYLAMSAALSVDANLYWTSLGHTGVDVNVYAKGNNVTGIHGNMENTDIGNWITSYLGVDQAAVTSSIAKTNVFQYPFKRPNTTFVYTYPGTA
ncbi:Alkaline phosphatase [Smittium mucronatum]|uniref:alkaline phosphatase n=1 Tax=Smittium mucronatum TaxID=133383 RepID=A0A1R0H7M6_9FUNG|nr:Alkaline phosphatase [Smittium mucronatum]